jgi:hypothetical protein
VLALRGRGFSCGNDSDHASALPLTVAHDENAQSMTDTKHDEALLICSSSECSSSKNCRAYSSKKTDLASSKETPCFFRLSRAFVGSHWNSIIHTVYVQSARRQFGPQRQASAADLTTRSGGKYVGWMHLLGDCSLAKQPVFNALLAIGRPREPAARATCQGEHTNTCLAFLNGDRRRFEYKLLHFVAR